MCLILLHLCIMMTYCFVYIYSLIQYVVLYNCIYVFILNMSRCHVKYLRCAAIYVPSNIFIYIITNQITDNAKMLFC